MKLDNLIAKTFFISFVGIIAIFACSIQKTGGGLYWQLEEIRGQLDKIDALERKLDRHTHQRHEKDKAVFYPVAIEENKDGEKTYYY